MLVAALLLAAPAVPPSLSALCPKAVPGEIVVCADGEPPKSPWRLPEPPPRAFGSRGSESVSRERNALIEPANVSSGSCSTVGPGGWTGCRYRDFKRSVEQAAGSRDPRGRLYEAAPR